MTKFMRRNIDSPPVVELLNFGIGYFIKNFEPVAEFLFNFKF